MATAVVMQLGAAMTWLRTHERVIGTIIGGVTAVSRTMTLTSASALLIAIVPLAAATIAFRLVNFSLFAMFLTPLVVLFVDFISSGNGAGIALARAFNDTLGSVIRLADCLMLWLDREPEGLCE